MREKKKLIIGGVALIVVTVILTTIVLSTLGFGRFMSGAEYKRYKKFIRLDNAIRKDFYKDINDEDFDEQLYKSLFESTGDEYSTYFTEEEMNSLLEMSSGKYEGVGLVVSPDKESGYIKVEQLLEGGSAKESGVKPGDYIIKVNGKEYTYSNMDLAVKNMRGTEGTKVKITFLRGEEEIEKTLERREITLESVKGKVLESDIGYIQITGFEENTDEEFDKVLGGLEKKKIKGLIIDLRNNGGGYLDVVQNISDRLLGDAVIVYTKDNAGKKVYYKSNDKEKVTIPIVILTNKNSASASEILTGAILDNKAGVSVGTVTYGKGLVQSVIQLPDGSGYKLTTSQYYTPNGNYINKKGIKPTIEVKDESQQLPKAIEHLKKNIK